MSNLNAKTTVYEKQANGKMFPLGQVVPNVDERIRKLENFPSAVVVTKPTIDGSLNLPEGGGSIKFAVSAQALLPDSSITKFDYWLDNNPAKTETAALNKATITVETPEGAQEGETFDLYVRAYDNNGSSNVNSVTLTVVSVGVSTPTISGKTEGVVKGEAAFTGSEFVLIGGEGNHDKSDWILYKSESSSIEIWSSKDDTENLTTVPEEINEILESNESYILKLRYHDSTMDLWSEYGSITFTTASIAVKTPVISGETVDVIGGNASFSGSPFEMIGVSESNHDKSDWLLVKADAPSSEIWSSKNDSINKTTSPDSFNDVLEVSTSYIIKLRYHDSITGAWSDWGELEFTTADDFLPEWSPHVKTQGIHFTVRGDGSNVNFFNHSTNNLIPDNCAYEVWINNSKTSYGIKSITFNDGDDILIKITKGTGFPLFCPYNTSGDHSLQGSTYLSSIVEPLPKMIAKNGEPITDFNRLLFRCGVLASIPDKLLANNPQVTNISEMFRECTLLTAVPDLLLYNLPNVTSASALFQETGLTQLSIDIFKNNPKIYGVQGCFYYCSALTPIIRFPQTDMLYVDRFANKCKAKGTVYVPQGSQTATKFKESADANVNIIEE